MTATSTNPYPRIKAYEQREFDRLTAYLQALDAGGWTEQSYCTDWQVYQVVSHVGSGSRIGGLRVRAWTAGGPPVARETMQEVWARFDALGPTEMLGAYLEASRAYLEVEAETPDAAGEQEVDGFAGKRPLAAYQLSRTWELACHSWDVYVARDRSVKVDPDAVSLLAAGMQLINLPLDKERGAALPESARPVGFRLLDSGAEYTLDPGAERPRVSADAVGEAPLVIEGPDEEVVRFLSGRGYVPGAQSALRVAHGTANDLAALRRAFR